MELGKNQLELKHVCKICSKSFASGTSLGGHMRSHVINDFSFLADVSKLSKKKLPPLSTHLLSNPNQNPTINNNINMNKKKNTESIYDINTGTIGYVLREKPRRSLKSSDNYSSEDNSSNNSSNNSGNNSNSLERSCKECGKVFQSWKALFGHMKCHLEKDRSLSSFEEEEVQDYSSTDINKSNSNLQLDYFGVNMEKLSKEITDIRTGIELRKMQSMKYITTKKLQWSPNDVTEIKNIKEEDKTRANLGFVERDVGVTFGLVNDKDKKETKRIMEQGAQVGGKDEGIQREETQQKQGEAELKEKGEKEEDRSKGVNLVNDDHYYRLQKFYKKCGEVEYQNLETQAYLKALLSNQKVIMENMGLKFLEPVLPQPFEEKICANSTIEIKNERGKESDEKGDEATQAIAARVKSQVEQVTPMGSSITPRSILKTPQRDKLSVRRRHASPLVFPTKPHPLSLDPIVEETIVPTPTHDPNINT